MKKWAYYNDNDPFICAWVRNLMKEGLIAPGVVDERSILDIYPEELREFTQVHMFCGIGGWSYALRLAGWPDDREVWTGSCPCQPFSAAGQGKGESDPRHLWPEWFRLIRECRPVTVFGEQVDAAIRHGWLDLVSGDLEGEGYALGAAVMGAHSVGAPHIRQRLYFVGHAAAEGLSVWTGEAVLGREARGQCERSGDAGSMDHPAIPRHDDPRPQGRRERGDGSDQRIDGEAGVAGGDAADSRSERRQQVGGSPSSHEEANGRAGRNGGEPNGDHVAGRDCQAGFWSPCDWLPCIDGKARPVEPGTFPLVDGAPNRVGRLRGYGNAIVPQVAQAFIQAYLEAI